MPSKGTNLDPDNTRAYLAELLQIGDPLLPIRRCSLGAITLVIHMAPRRQRRIMAAQPKSRILRKEAMDLPDKVTLKLGAFVGDRPLVRMPTSVEVPDHLHLLVRWRRTHPLHEVALHGHRCKVSADGARRQACCRRGRHRALAQFAELAKRRAIMFMKCSILGLGATQSRLFITELLLQTGMERLGLAQGGPQTGNAV